MTGIWLVLFLCLWLFVMLLAFLLVGALRQIGLLTLRLGDDPGVLITDFGLDRGAEAPRFEGVDVDSGAIVDSDHLDARARVLTFVTPSCLACRTLIPHLNEVTKTRPEFDYLVICRGDLESCARLRHSERLIPPMIVDGTGAIETAFDVQVTPFVYLVSSDERILLRGVANDWRHLDSLLDQEGMIQASPWAIVEESGAPSASDSGGTM